MTARKITAEQVKKIHVLTSALKMPDEDYRYLLAAGFRGVTTSLDLDEVEAAALILGLEEQAVRAGVWKRPSLAAAQAQGRPGKATPKQLWKIRDLWSQVSRTVPERREEALGHFLERRFKISRIEWLDMKKASNVIVTLSAMANDQASREAA